MGHNLLAAHGLALQAIRAVNPNLQVGIVLNLWMQDAASDSPEDVAAANLAFERSETLFLDPIFKGHYPAGTYEMAGESMPKIKDGDMALIAQRLDYLGVNFYSRNLISTQGQIEPVPGSEYTEMGWEVCAPALRRMLVKINSEYNLPPIIITSRARIIKKFNFVFISISL